MTELNRLHWQCRRGMLELDTLLLTFLESRYGSLSHNEQEVFAELLNCPDQLLFEYLMGEIQPIDKDVAHVVEQIRHPAQV